MEWAPPTLSHVVAVPASPSRADTVDNAPLKPGPLERQVSFDLPTLQQRRGIFWQHLKSLQLTQASRTSSQCPAKPTPGFTGRHRRRL